MANVQIVLNYEIFDKPMANVTYWQMPEFSVSYLQNFADALRVSLVAHWQTLVTDHATFLGIIARQMDGGGAFSLPIEPTAGALPGQNTNPALPTTVALLVSTSANAARPNRGRIYFGGLCENNQEDSQWGNGSLTAFEDMVTSWATGLTVAGGNSFLRIARPDFAANDWVGNNPVELVVARPFPATIRNRRLGT